ncbi:MAG: DNRLRE domain-containing protein, partial [Actinomycetota bacterium]
MLLLQLVAIVPASTAQEATSDGRDRVTDVSQLAVEGEPVKAEPIADEDRTSVPVPLDENGVIDPEITELDPGEENKLENLIGDEVREPELSGADFDVYAPDTETGTHFAVLYPGLVNELNAKGEWVPYPTELTETPAGWVAKGETFTVLFPLTIGPKAPVVYTNGDSSLSGVPEGVIETKGIVEGATVTYAGALPGADLVYALAPGGYKETVVLTDQASVPELTWSLEVKGFELAETEDERIELLRDGEVVAEMPVPAVLDSTENPEGVLGDYILGASADGAFSLSLSIDPAWLASATFPVFVDPGSVTPNASYDTYAKSSSPDGTFGGSSPLLTGPATGGGTKHRAFMRFTTAWEQPDRVVWSAELNIKNVTEGTNSNTLEIKRATWDWGNALTWNTMMNQSGEGVSGTPYVPDGTGAEGAWWDIELRRLYQDYADGLYNDYGFRMSSADEKKFTSFEGSSNQP